MTRVDKNGEAKSVQESFPLPEVEDAFVYNNSIGLSYEAAAVQLALMQGRTEVEEFTHEESLTLARIEVCVHGTAWRTLRYPLQAPAYTPWPYLFDRMRYDGNLA